MSVPDQVIQFVADVEAYYGKYPPKIKIGVLEALKINGRWASGVYLDRLYDALTDTFSPKWGKVPSKIEIREAMDAMPPAPFTAIQPVTSESQQITDDAGSIPGHYGEEFVRDILMAFRNGDLKTSDDPDDERLTPIEFEQKWREKKGFA